VRETTVLYCCEHEPRDQSVARLLGTIQFAYRHTYRQNLKSLADEVPRYEESDNRKHRKVMRLQKGSAESIDTTTKFELRPHPIYMLAESVHMLRTHMAKLAT
jgi:hypothetical protein